MCETRESRHLHTMLHGIRVSYCGGIVSLAGFGDPGEAMGCGIGARAAKEFVTGGECHESGDE